MKREERNQLIDDLLDGTLGEADFLRLEAELHVNAEARRDYYDRLKLDTVLRLEAEGAEPPDFGRNPVEGLPITTRRSVVIALTVFAASVVLLLLAGTLGWQIGRSGTASLPSAAVRAEPSAVGFGVLAEHADAVWEHGLSLGRGDLLPPGAVRLLSGAAQIELFSGVTLIVEGAAEFEILSSMEMEVREGRLRAVVPEPARGFRIGTASGDIVDLGTEFALDVTPDRAEVHVLDGEIEYHSPGQPMRLMRGGDSMGWSADGAWEELPPAQRRFAGPGDIARNREERRLAWVEHSERLRDDPRLLLYLPLNAAEPDSRRAVDVSGANRHGTVVRAHRAADRWGQPGGGLDFGPAGSRVRLTIPGEHGSLTFFCWVRIDGLDRWFNSLFLTDGHERNEPHWQIMDDGRLFFSVKRRDGPDDKHVAYSPPIWTPALSGTWMQLATVYDVEAWTTTHYVNGSAVSEDRIPSRMRVDRVSIGAASIGNWSEPKRNDPHFAMRNLNGVIDEFAIFSDALDAEEIRHLYEIGRP